MDRETLCRRIEAGERVKFLLFWGHRPDPRGIGPTCLSQWFEAPFEVDGHRYPTAEHWMMAEKARLFGDGTALERVLACGSPGAAKRIGREVRGFDQALWETQRVDIVVRGNLAKFGQHEDLAAFLRWTGNRVLVEASPRDRIWGIGMSATHEHAEVPQRWRGQNLLGFALMDVREQLATGR